LAQGSKPISHASAIPTLPSLEPKPAMQIPEQHRVDERVYQRVVPELEPPHETPETSHRSRRQLTLLHDALVQTGQRRIFELQRFEQAQHRGILRKYALPL